MHDKEKVLLEISVRLKNLSEYARFLANSMSEDDFDQFPDNHIIALKRRTGLIANYLGYDYK